MMVGRRFPLHWYLRLGDPIDNRVLARIPGAFGWCGTNPFDTGIGRYLSTLPDLARILACSSFDVGLWSTVMLTASNPVPSGVLLPKTPLESPTHATLRRRPSRNATQAVLPLNSQSILVAFMALSTSRKPVEMLNTNPHALTEHNGKQVCQHVPWQLESPRYSLLLGMGRFGKSWGQLTALESGRYISWQRLQRFRKKDGKMLFYVSADGVSCKSPG